MKPVLTDVDIDVFDRDRLLTGFNCVLAAIDDSNDRHIKHNTGIYLQNMPRDPFTGIADVNYKIASEYGYFKIDILNVNVYNGIKSENHLIRLMNTTPVWEAFEYQEITDQLFHLHGYSRLLQRYKPKSVEDLAMILAIIRPAKAYLQYESWDKIRAEVWTSTNTDYQFKRSHSIGYSLVIIVQLNLISEQTINQLPE